MVLIKELSSGTWEVSSGIWELSRCIWEMSNGTYLGGV